MSTRNDPWEWEPGRQAYYCLVHASHLHGREHDFCLQMLSARDPSVKQIKWLQSIYIRLTKVNGDEY